MFPRLRQQLLARVDVLVELSTLGEYGIDERGTVMALEPECESPALSLAPRVRGRCASDGRLACATARDRAGSARP
jgi:hypothetical protein